MQITINQSFITKDFLLSNQFLISFNNDFIMYPQIQGSIKIFGIHSLDIYNIVQASEIKLIPIVLEYEDAIYNLSFKKGDIIYNAGNQSLIISKLFPHKNIQTFLELIEVEYPLYLELESIYIHDSNGNYLNQNIKKGFSFTNIFSSVMDLFDFPVDNQLLNNLQNLHLILTKYWTFSSSHRYIEIKARDILLFLATISQKPILINIENDILTLKFIQQPILESNTNIFNLSLDEILSTTTHLQPVDYCGSIEIRESNTSSLFMGTEVNNITNISFPFYFLNHSISKILNASFQMGTDVLFILETEIVDGIIYSKPGINYSYNPFVISFFNIQKWKVDLQSGNYSNNNELSGFFQNDFQKREFLSLTHLKGYFFQIGDIFHYENQTYQVISIIHHLSNKIQQIISISYEN